MRGEPRISGAQDREGDKAKEEVTGYLNVEFRIQNAECQLKNEDEKKYLTLPRMASVGLG
jgi:hypothetical protein